LAPRTIPETRATARALLLLVASATMFGLMAFSAKLATARLSGPQVAMIRFAVGLAPLVFIPRVRRAAFDFKRWDLLLVRGIFGGLAVLFYFICIEHSTIGVATLLNYTAPLYSGLFSMLFIGEKFSAKVLFPLPIALLGVFLVVHAHARPGEILGFRRWEVIGALSAVCSAIAVTAIRAARRTESSWSVYASFCIIGLLTTLPLGISTWRNPLPDEWYALAATSLFAIGAQLAMTFSLRWVDAMTVGVMSQLAVVVSMILGAAFIGEHILPMAAIGSALTIGGVAGVTWITSMTRPIVAAVEVAPEA
jgi:drug/metabolite transporter (DMT)-like permease